MNIFWKIKRNIRKKIAKTELFTTPTKSQKSNAPMPMALLRSWPRRSRHLIPSTLRPSPSRQLQHLGNSTLTPQITTAMTAIATSCRQTFGYRQKMSSPPCQPLNIHQTPRRNEPYRKQRRGVAEQCTPYEELDSERSKTHESPAKTKKPY